MADDKPLSKRDELTEDGNRKIEQKISGSATIHVNLTKPTNSAQKILKAIECESKQSKISDSKLENNQILGLTHSAKLSKHNRNPISENVLQDNNNIPDLINDITETPQATVKKSSYSKLLEDSVQNLLPDHCEKCFNQNLNVFSSLSKKDSKINLPLGTSTIITDKKTEKQNEINQEQLENYGNSPDVVSEEMYLLQQRAHNVLKVLADKRLSERSVPLSVKEKASSGSYMNNLCKITPKSSTEIKQPNESVEIKLSKPSNKNIKEPLVKTSLSKLTNQNDLSKKRSESKTDFSSLNNFQNNISCKLLNEKKLEIENTVMLSESQQTDSSTEKCTNTTDYITRNTTDHAVIHNEISAEKELNNSNSNPVFQKECSDHITEAIFQELSQIIQSNDAIDTDILTKRGEVICYFFKQKLLNKLKASGNLDVKATELVNRTASKFAKWMEDILKEIDDRKKTTSNNLKVLKDDTDEDEFLSASSSKESFTHRSSSPVQNDEVENKPEVVKILEISEDELKEKYGLYLDDKTKHEVFNFVGPDERPVEVKHLLIDECDAKVMVVKKYTTESQSSCWIVEVGPGVKLDAVTDSVSKNLIKDEKGKESITLYQGECNLKKIGWENWLPKVIEEIKKTHRKMPILRKQCMLRESDFEIDYPTYSPSLLALGSFENSLCDANKIILPTPPQHEPSAPQEP